MDIQDEGGLARKLPTVAVGWDEEAQTTVLKFDNTEFRNWDLVVMTLGSALDLARFNRDLLRTQAAQRAALEHAQAEAIRQRLLRGK